jgi:beta-carotene hydroxylase
MACIGPLLWQPTATWHWLLDIAVRTYLGFLGTVMAHEATHGALGRGRVANLFWGRLALVPMMVPFANFRRTHLLHHAHTNHPTDDPDYFMNSKHAWQIPLRALGMPHHWFFWLLKRRKLRRRDLIELVWNYLSIFLVYGLLIAHSGWLRVTLGMLPPLIFVSLILWYPFAFKTHEGYSLGAQEARSHNYYGTGMFWLTLGLSMHRVHHMQPKLSWIEILPWVQSSPEKGWQRFIPRRDIRTERLSS